MKEIDLSNQVEEADNIETEFSGILLSLKKNVDAESIYLRGNAFNEKQIEPLSNALTDHQSLEVLDLAANNMRAAAMPLLVKIIRTHPDLRMIVLDFNKITDSDLNVLMDHMPESNGKPLQIEINLACNYITEASLPRAFKTLNPVTVLSMLNGNRILNKDVIEEYRSAALQKIEDSKTNTQDIASASFTPLRDARVASPSEKPESLEHNKIFEEKKEPVHQNMHPNSPR